VGVPTTNFTVSTLVSEPSQLFRVGIFTNTTEFVANASKNAGDKDASYGPNRPHCLRACLQPGIAFLESFY
jgi:hypothetical protein